MMTVIVYSRYGCHLCEDLLEDLESLADEHGFGIEVRDVDSHCEWLQKYHTRVPVVEVDGEFVCEYFLDPATLLARLERGG